MPRRTEAEQLQDDIQKAPDGSLWIVRTPDEASHLSQLLRAAGKTAGKLVVKSRAGRIHYRRMQTDEPVDIDAAYELPMASPDQETPPVSADPPVIEKPLEVPHAALSGLPDAHPASEPAVANNPPPPPMP